MSPNHYVRESGVNYRLVDRRDHCKIGGDPEIVISLSNYGIDKVICRGQETWWEVINSDIDTTAKFYYQFIPPLSYLLGGYSAIKIAIKIVSNDFFKHVSNIAQFSVSYNCFNIFNPLFAYLAKYSSCYMIDKFNSLIDPIQQQVSKIITDHPKELLYMVQLPGECLNKNEELKVFYNESYPEYAQWRLCFKDRPKLKFDTQPFYSVVEDIISYTLVVGPRALILHYRQEIFILICNSADYMNLKTGVLFGITASLAKALYDSYLNFPELSYINFEQIEANKYVSVHNSENLYLIQAPANCNEGDKSVQDFKNLFGFGEVKWHTCQMIGETETSLKVNQEPDV